MRKAFYLNSGGVKKELKVYNKNKLLSFCLFPTYFMVKLNRSLTFCHRFVGMRKKNYLLVSHCLGDFRRWDAGPKHCVQLPLSGLLDS